MGTYWSTEELSEEFKENYANLLLEALKYQKRRQSRIRRKSCNKYVVNWPRRWKLNAEIENHEFKIDQTEIKCLEYLVQMKKNWSIKYGYCNSVSYQIKQSYIDWKNRMNSGYCNSNEFYCVMDKCKDYDCNRRHVDSPPLIGSENEQEEENVQEIPLPWNKLFTNLI